MRVLLDPDANPGGASSTPPNDAKPTGEASSTPSSGAENSGEGSEPKNVDELINNVMAASQTAKPESAKGEVQNLNQTPPQEGQTGDQGKEATEVTPEDEKGEEQVPFHEHPRWKEMVTERDELRRQVAELTPIRQEAEKVRQFCDSYQITQDQHYAALEVAALLNSDPAKALERLKPIVEQLSQFDGTALPEDLRNEVDEGIISEERAQEIAKLRAQTRMGETRQQQFAVRQQQAYVRAVSEGLSSWQSSKAKLDPDFRPKKTEGDPDGKYELFVDRLHKMWSAKPPESAQQAIAQAEQAYESVQKALGRYIPAKPSVKSLGATPASKTKAEPETPEDVVNEVLSKHGISV